MATTPFPSGHPGGRESELQLENQSNELIRRAPVRVFTIVFSKVLRRGPGQKSARMFFVHGFGQGFEARSRPGERQHAGIY